MTRWPARLGEMEVERVEQVDGGVRRVHRHVRRDVEQRLRVVEDDLRAGRDERIRGVLRRVGGNCDDAHDDVALARDLRNVFDRADREVADALADLVWVVVEDRRDMDAVLGEDRRARDRASQAPGSYQCDVVLPLRAEDLTDLLEERVRAIPDTTLTELPERREVAPDLRGVDVRVLRDLLRRDPLLAHLARLGQHLQVPAQAGGDSHRETFGHLLPLSKVCDKASRFCQRLFRRRRRNRTDPGPKRLGVHEIRERELALELDGREQLAVAGLELRHAADVDELELESELVAERADDLERLPAEAAVRCVVDDDSRYG